MTKREIACQRDKEMELKGYKFLGNMAAIQEKYLVEAASELEISLVIDQETYDNNANLHPNGYGLIAVYVGTNITQDGIDELLELAEDLRDREMEG